MRFAPTPLKNVPCDESASGGIAPAEAVPRSEVKRNEEYKRKTGRVMKGVLGWASKKEKKNENE